MGKCAAANVLPLELDDGLGRLGSREIGGEPNGWRDGREWAQ